MKKFKYRAKKSPEETREGVLLAGSRDEAIDQINAMGLLPVDVDEERQSKSQGGGASPSLFKRKVGGQALAIFYRQLAKLIKSGVPILRALEIVSEQTGNLYFRGAIDQIHQEIKEGNPLSEALMTYKNIFSTFDIAMIQAGESVGKLDEALIRLVTYLEQQEVLKSKVRTATAYPIFVITMGAISVFVMLTFVIPKFTRFFADLGQELPLSTRILIDVSNWSKTGWIWIVAACFGFSLFLKYMQKTQARKRKIDLFLLSLPKINEVIKKFEIARLSRALELLLSSGM